MNNKDDVVQKIVVYLYTKQVLIKISSILQNNRGKQKQIKKNRNFYLESVFDKIDYFFWSILKTNI